MFYKKSLTTKQNKPLKIRFDKFDEWKSENKGDLQINQTDSCYNFAFSNGQLSPSYGFEQLTLPVSLGGQEQTFNLNATEILQAWFFPMYDNFDNCDKYYVFFLAQDMKIYFFNVLDEKYIYPTDATFTQIPNGAAFRINGDNDTMFFASSTDQTVGLNGLGYQVYQNIPKFVSGCWFGPYFFLLTIGDNNQLQYSQSRIDIWNDDNVTRAPLADIRGGMTKLIALKDYLYLFTNYGITRLSLYSSSADVAETHVYHSSSYIYPSSISKHGEEIVFLSGDGLYRLKGSSVTKIDLPFSQNITSQDNSKCSGVCFDGKYFLACKYNFADDQTVGCESQDYVNNAMVVYDLATGEFEVIRGIDINQLFALQAPKANKLCALFRGEKKALIGQLTHDGKFFGSPLAKRWVSAQTDFGYAENQKCITEVIVRPNTQGTITICSEKESQSIQVANSNQCTRFRLRIYGKIFYLTFDCQQQSVNISCPQLTAEVIS